MLVVSRAVLFSCASLHFPRFLLCCLTLLVAFIVACWHGRVCSGGWDGVGGWGGVGGVGGVGGGGGGMITFLFINVPACAFLTRCSLLQVMVWHAFVLWSAYVDVGIRWRCQEKNACVSHLSKALKAMYARWGWKKVASETPLGRCICKTFTKCRF